MFLNYYKILDIPEDATEEDVKKAYRTKAKKYHPDVYKGEDAKSIFQLLNEAYHILIDETKRSRYDYKLKNQMFFDRKYKPTYTHTRGRENTYADYYERAYRRQQYYEQQKAAEEEPMVEPETHEKVNSVLFYTMLLVGSLAIIFGTVDLFVKEWEGIDNLSGLFFGVSFTFLLLYGWRLRKKGRIP